jgi:uncharacterized protein YjbJ (UPF0337 family)
LSAQGGDPPGASLAGFFFPITLSPRKHIMDKNQVKGEMHKAKGKVKEVAGRTIGNDKMENEGKLEHAKGTVQKAYGDLKSDVKKATK